MTNVTESYNLIDGTMQLCPKNKGKYITHTSLTYSDYDNSCSIERANVAYIKEIYASNRYHLVTSGWGYNHVYLKNTKLNAELINNLAECYIIDDEYLSDWEYQHAEIQFLDTELDEFKPIYMALEQFYTDKDVDICVISSSNYFWQLYNAIANEFNTYYHFENSNCVYRSNGFNTDKVIEYCIEYFNQYPMFVPIQNNNVIWNDLIDQVYGYSDDAIYCLIVYSYNHLQLVAGSSDYLTSHLDPFCQIEIDAGMSKLEIQSILHDAYNEIVEYAYEKLDITPVN